MLCRKISRKIFVFLVGEGGGGKLESQNFLRKNIKLRMAETIWSLHAKQNLGNWIFCSRKGHWFPKGLDFLA